VALNHDDPDWRAKMLRTYRTSSKVNGFAASNNSSAKNDRNTMLERWLQSASICIKRLPPDDLKTRTAFSGVFETWNDLRWYIQRKGNTQTKTCGSGENLA